MKKIYITNKTQQLTSKTHKNFTLYIKKNIRCLLLFFILISCTANGFSQVGINTEDPHETSDLTLGSSDKGLLPNRVALESVSSAAPLKNTIVNGTIVYNTNSNGTDLEEGLYIWQKENWRKLLTSTGKTTDFKVLLFNKTGEKDEKTLRYSSNPATIPEKDEIPALSGEFTIEKNGTIMINAVIYAKLQIKAKTLRYTFVGNTFFKIIVTDNTTGISTTFITACSPVSTSNTDTFTNETSWITTNNNPEAALCQGELRVIKGHNYSVKVYGQEGWVGPGEGTVKAGTYTWNQYRAYSTLRIDYASDPY